MQVIINAGSSSLKWALFDGDTQVLKGVFDSLKEDCVLHTNNSEQRVEVSDHTQAVLYLIDLLAYNGLARPEQITQVVHRVVHGGERYSAPAVITEGVIADIERFAKLAPLHNPANLAGIRACQKAMPSAQHVAVFDTAFHHSIAKEVFLYGIPYELYEKHRIRKYGFHGINHEYIAKKLQHEHGRSAQIISCHLGSGSSITAVRAQKSVDTTMGFTPLDGVMMATRTGELDPEIPLFLLKHDHYSIEELEDVFNNKSGFFGLTGHKDLREIYALSQKGDSQCQLTIDMLSYRVAYYISALRVATPKLVAIAFTGGIGEGAWYVRKKVCEYLGFVLDNKANKEHKQLISAPKSPVSVHVIGANEEWMMHELAKSL